MTKRTITLLFVSAVLMITGVALSELVHPWGGIAVILAGSCLMAWTMGSTFAEAANRELEELKEKTRKLDEEYAAFLGREERNDNDR